MDIVFRLRCPKYTFYFRCMSTRWCVDVCGCVDERGRRRREGGTEGGREAGREGGMENRSHGAAARRTHVIRGWLRRCLDDTGAGFRIASASAGFWPPEWKLKRQPGAFTAAGSYSLGFLPGLSLEKTWFRIMNGPELDIFKFEGL